MDLETKVFAGKEFKSIQAEVVRCYVFPDDQFVDIEEPLWLHVSDSGGHYVIVSDNETIYIPPGWIALYWETEFGQGPIQF